MLQAGRAEEQAGSGSDDVAPRRLGPEDAAAYRTFRLAALQAAPDVFGSTYAVEAAWPVESHAGRLASSVVFGAFEGRRLIGVIGFKRQGGPKEAHKGFLWGFYVEPGHRGRGVGGGLLSAALAAARELVEQVTLTVVSGNGAAANLYERFGFRRFGVEPRALKGEGGYADEELMVLFLDA